MATTTNYGWTTPDDTSLVKDGAAAIRTLGSSVDTTTKALNPSTTLGDIEYRSATANTNTRLGIGSTGNVLTVAGGVPTWAAPAAGGGMTLIATGTGTGSAAAINFTSIPSTYKHLCIVFQEVRTAANTTGKMTFNSNGSSYDFRYFGTNGSNDENTTALVLFPTITDAAAAAAFANGVFWLFDYSGSQANKTGTMTAATSNLSDGGFSNNTTRSGTLRWRNTAAISSIQIENFNTSNFGTSTVIKLYGVS